MYTQLLSTIDELQANGKKVTVTKLPSQAKRTHKSVWGINSKAKGSTKVS